MEVFPKTRAGLRQLVVLLTVAAIAALTLLAASEAKAQTEIRIYKGSGLSRLSPAYTATIESAEPWTPNPIIIPEEPAVDVQTVIWQALFDAYERGNISLEGYCAEIRLRELPEEVCYD